MTRADALPTPHGDALFVAYAPDGSPEMVVTRGGNAVVFPTPDGAPSPRYEQGRGASVVRTVKRWRFVRSERDGVTYAAVDDFSDDFDRDLEDSDRVLFSGRLVAEGDGPPMRVWHAAELDVRRVSYDRDTTVPRAVKTPVVSDEDWARLGAVRIGAPLAACPFDGTEAIDRSALVCCEACGPMRVRSLCQHLGVVAGWLFGPGSGVGLGSLLLLARALGCVRALRRRLRASPPVAPLPAAPLAGDIDLVIAGVRFSGRASELGQRDVVAFREGTIWLCGLDDAIPEATVAALALLDGEVAAQDARRASGERSYGVRAHARQSGWVVRGVSWADALAALRALPPGDRDRSDGQRARITRAPPKKRARQGAKAENRQSARARRADEGTPTKVARNPQKGRRP